RGGPCGKMPGRAPPCQSRDRVPFPAPPRLAMLPAGTPEPARGEIQRAPWCAAMGRAPRRASLLGGVVRHDPRAPPPHPRRRVGHGLLGGITARPALVFPRSVGPTGGW